MVIFVKEETFIRNIYIILKKYRKLVSMKLLAVKQPWASLICLGIKDVENRTWRQDSLVGGKLLIMSCKKNEVLNTTNTRWKEEYLSLVDKGKVPSLDSLPKGKIIGYVDVAAIVEESDSVWSADASHYKYVLKNAHLFKTPLIGVHGQPRPINYPMSLSDLLAIPTSDK